MRFPLIASFASLIAAVALPASAFDSPNRLIVAGEVRTFELTSTSRDARAIIIALHPRPASGAAMRHISGLDDHAEAGRYLVAYPDGPGGAWRPDDAGGPDEAFIVALADHLKEMLGQPSLPIYVVGVSNGASMAERLLISRPDLFAGAALVSGGFAEGAEASAPSSPMPGPLLVMIGEADAEVARLTAAAAARRDRYRCRSVSSQVVAGAVLARHDCGGIPLEEWRMEAGHAWPGATDSGPLSWPDAPFRAADEILRVFGLSDGPAGRGG